MPIREYRCIKCNNVMEVLEKIGEKPLEICPECGGKLEKLISNSSFVLKGSGWYKTDYTKTGEKSQKPKTETKTEAKTEAANTAPNTPCSCGTGTCGRN